MTRALLLPFEPVVDVSAESGSMSGSTSDSTSDSVAGSVPTLEVGFPPSLEALVVPGLDPVVPPPAPSASPINPADRSASAPGALPWEHPSSLEPASGAHARVVYPCRVVLHVQLSNEDFGAPEDRDVLFAVIDELVRALEIARLGEVASDLWGHGVCSIELAGDDALHLCSIAREVLGNTDLPAGFVLEVIRSDDVVGGAPDAQGDGRAA